MPVSLATLFAFVTASLVLLVIPGPTIIMVISQTLAHGRRVVLASVLGVALGDLVAATFSLVGLGTVLAASAAIFTAVKWAGALYLVYIGITMWRTPISLPEIEAQAGAKNRRRLFRSAFLVTVLNPKGIVFFMAFVPQFIVHDAPFAPQAAVFVATFVLLGIINALAYVHLAASARQMLRRPAIIRRTTRTGAALLVGAGVASAFAQRAS